MNPFLRTLRAKHWMQLDAVAYGVVLAVVLVAAAFATVFSRFTD